jgi:hypothetical protein
MLERDSPSYIIFRLGRQQFGQLGDVGGDAPRFVHRERLA